MKLTNTDVWLGRIGLLLVLCYCFGVSLFQNRFAQIHLTLHGCPFPIFISEILLFICLFLFIGISKDAHFLTQKSTILWGLYFSWVLIKTLINLHFDGPLSARNAALFYYPIFAIFGYYFYSKGKIPHIVFMTLAILAVGVLIFKIMNLYYWWTYFLLLAIAACNIKSLKWRWVVWIVFAGILFLGKEYLYQGSRSHIGGVFCAIIFLTGYVGGILIKARSYVRLSFMIVFFILILFGYSIFSENCEISSVISLKGIVKSYQILDKQCQIQKVNYVPQKLATHLYNYKQMPSKAFTALSHPSDEPVDNTEQKSPASSLSKDNANYGKSNVIKNIVMNNIMYNQIFAPHNTPLNEDNTVFRLFIWRDMIQEQIEKKAWWGFSFGHPQRSKSLEAMHWAETEWSRDGWITPHNSFLHIIYRSGILGVVLIGVLFYMLSKLIKDFFGINCIEGGLLIGILIYWLVLSNFLVILEFPYNAIVFWTLFGIAWAYRDGLMTKHGN